MGRASRAVCALLAVVGWAGTEPVHAASSFSILKVDPNPVAAGTPVEILFQFENTETTELLIRVELAGAATKHEKTVSVPPGGMHVDSFELVAAAPGRHDLELRAFQAVGFILVRKGPTDIERRPRWGKPIIATTSYTSFSPVTPPARPRESRIGPRDPGTNSPDQNSHAGAIWRVAGRVAALYAVSKHAGVWKNANDGMWRQLRGSPRRAGAIAVDPSDVNHVVVGERADDTTVSEAGDIGVSESFDGGETWQRILDPALDPRFAAAPGINDVAFGPYGRSLLVATSIGIGVRAARPDRSEASRGFEFPASARGPVRELASNENTVWAFDNTGNGRLLQWTMSPAAWRDLDLNRPATWAAWTAHPVPATVDVFPESGTDPAVAGGITDSRGGLSGFDDLAFLSVNPVVGPAHPRAAEDPACAPPNSASRCDIFKNRMAILIFDPRLPAGAQWRAQLSGDNDGRGLGGRAFTAARTLECPSLPAEIGRRRRLYLGAGQSVQEALSIDPAGRLTWSKPAGARSHRMHVDFWDIHVDTAVCPPAQFAAWIPTDGGVFRGRVSGGGIGTRPNPDFEGAIDGLEWTSASLGLETQNVHLLAFAKRPGDTLPFLLYATGDNDGWWGRPGGPWYGGGTAGDANVALADGASKWGIAFRGFNGGGTCGGGNCAYAVTFGSEIDRSFNIGGRPTPFASPTVFTFIQKLASEATAEPVQAAMLVQLPFRDGDGNPIAGALGTDNPASRTAIIRTADYASTLGVFTSGWTIAVDDVPAEAERFWVSGGTANPRYFVFTPRSATCPAGLQRRDTTGNWQCLRQDLAFADDEAARELRTMQTFMAPAGPVFVDPYNPDIIVALVLGANPRVDLTLNGGNDWCPMPALTGLATESGRFPLAGDDGFGRMNPDTRYGQSGLGNRYHGSILPRIAQVAFDRSYPTRAVVVTPTSGVYYGDFALTAMETKRGVRCQEPVWRALQKHDDNWGYPSTGTLLDGIAYLGTEGNGVFQISNLDTGLIATYFDLGSTFSPGATAATIRTARGVVAWGRYVLRIAAEVDNPARATNPNAPARLTRATTVRGRTNGAGEVVFPAGSVVADLFPPGTTVVCDLGFPGDGRAAPARVRFKCSP